MLTPKERRLVYRQAYLPEQLIDYVEGISGAEAHIHGEYLYFIKGDHLLFIGYPLGTQADTQQVYEQVCHSVQPATVAVIAPQLWFPPDICQNWYEDNYYRLTLPLLHIRPDVIYMARRAGRELQVVPGKYGEEHQKLVREFLAGHELAQEQRLIFNNISHYTAGSGTARLLEARRQNGALVAFSIMDLGTAEYAFYLFNFRSAREKAPGASDLLFHEMVCLAEKEGKGFINLGLGINPGIRHFKEKWGAQLFLPHKSCLIRRRPAQIGGIFDKL